MATLTFHQWLMTKTNEHGFDPVKVGTDDAEFKKATDAWEESQKSTGGSAFSSSKSAHVPVVTYYVAFQPASGKSKAKIVKSDAATFGKGKSQARNDLEARYEILKSAGVEVIVLKASGVGVTIQGASVEDIGALYGLTGLGKVKVQDLGK